MGAAASLTFARNAARFCKELISDGKVSIDMDNEVIAAMLATHEGRVVFGQTQSPQPEKPALEPKGEPDKPSDEGQGQAGQEAKAEETETKEGGS